VKLEYLHSGDDFWNLIVNDIPVSINFFKWKVPQNINGQITLKVSDVNDESTYSLVEVMIKYDQQKNEEETENILGKVNSSALADPIRIMPLGNSITRGSTGSDDRVGYRRKLFLSLSGSGYNVDFVGSRSLGIPSDFDKDHEGHSGWHARHPSNPDVSIADNLNSFLQLNPPKIILLHLGTNDIIGMEALNEDEFDVVDDIDTLLNIIDAFEDSIETDIYVVVSKIINREDDSSTTIIAEDSITSAYNNELENLVNSRIISGDKLFLVDQESALEYPDDLFDGIHPTQTGYDKMADVWLSALEEIIGEIPLIISQPNTKGRIEGDSVSFKIIAEGSEYLYYQWQKNGIDIPDADSNILFIPFVGTGENNSIYTCKVSNLLGTTFSEEAVL
jgi:hypothetical protein